MNTIDRTIKKIEEATDITESEKRRVKEKFLHFISMSPADYRNFIEEANDNQRAKRNILSDIGDKNSKMFKEISANLDFLEALVSIIQLSREELTNRYHHYANEEHLSILEKEKNE